MNKRGMLLLIILVLVSACGGGEKPAIPSQTRSIIGS